MNKPVVVGDRKELLEKERKRTAELVSIGAAYGAADKVEDWIQRGIAPGDAALEVLNSGKTTGRVQPSAEQVTAQFPERDMRDYSYLRAINNALEGVQEGLEWEVHKELERNLPQGYKRNAGNKSGILVPLTTRPRGQRAVLDALTATKGTETVFDTPGELIELLRPRAVVMQSGARSLTGLTGPVPFPKQTAAATVTWVAENPATDAGDGEPALGLVTLTPKTMQGNIPFTRQLLAQSSIDIEAWVREEIAIAHGLAIDKAALHGLGSAGQPEGVYLATGVNSKDFSGTKPALGTLMDMVTPIFTANAGVATLRWITTPGMAGSMRTTLEFPSSAGTATLWQGNLLEGSMLGYFASSTTQLSTTMTGSDETGGANHGLVFGNWADMYIALFGALELVVDPYSRKKRAIIEVTSFQMGDVMLRHGESFSKGINAPTS